MLPHEGSTPLRCYLCSEIKLINFWLSGGTTIFFFECHGSFDGDDGDDDDD